MEAKILEQIVDRSSRAWGVTRIDAKKLLSINHQKALRINTLKQTKKTTAELKKYFGLLPIKWSANSYIITKNYSEASKSKLFKEGYFILQDQASFIPVLALDAKPNDFILDMCAAPGAKTSHIACITANRSKIIANDSSKNRLFKLRGIVKDHEVKAELTLYDGRNLIKQYGPNLFDRILLDAPCSGEARIDPNTPSTYNNWTLAKIKRLSRLQEQLITVAYDLLKPNGILVYSTCTISPEENEKVVNRLLKKREAVILPINIEIDGSMKGLSLWNGKQYSTQVINTKRLVPTENHEAFYVAKITKPLDSSIDEYQYKI